jgi:hypothetical protein
MSLENGFQHVVSTPSDINQHIPLLFAYTKRCSSVVECGVRSIVSSYGFALGLVGTPNNNYVMIDTGRSDQIEPFLNLCRDRGVNASFVEQSDLECPLVQTDLLFIDTWHVYGQLKRELARWHGSVAKYIIMHDTTTYGEQGESALWGHNPVVHSQQSGFPIDEVLKGLWPAVEDFLREHPEWKVELRLTNNNGLTILTRS